MIRIFLSYLEVHSLSITSYYSFGILICQLLPCPLLPFFFLCINIRVKLSKKIIQIILTILISRLGPALRLFGKSYYELLAAALKPNGVIASQAGTVWDSLSQVKSTFDICKATFPITTYAVTAVPTYPTGQIGFIIGGLNNVSMRLYSKLRSGSPLKFIFLYIAMKKKKTFIYNIYV